VPAIVWKNEYSVGVKVIDDQHKELFRRVNSFSMMFPKAM